MVPIASIKKEGGSSYVFVIKNGFLIKTKVEVADKSSNYARISRGIEEGDYLVNDPDAELKDGQEVLIK
jgi:hypothetical protein